MQKIRIGEIDLNVLQEGDGPPLLLVHGFPLDHTMWEAQIVEFRRDHRVIAPDLRGFGGSGLGSDAISMAGLADDLAALLIALDVTDPVVFCGLSMGGYIAWQFWDRHAERLAKLILCDTRAAADSPDAAQGRRATAEQVRNDGTGALIEGMLPKLFAETTRRTQTDLVQSIRRVMEATDPASVAAALLAMADRPDMRDRLNEIAVPTLVLCGQHDVITPAEEMRQVAAALPQAQFEEISDAGHMAPAEQPDAVNRVLRAFLQHGA